MPVPVPLRFPAGLFALVLAGATAGAAPIKAGESVPELGLVTQGGEAFSLSRLEGRTVILSFVYTRCADVCPLTLLSLKQALASQGLKGREPAVVLITVDPERDDPDSFSQFLRAWDPSFVGLSGPHPAVHRALQLLGVRFQKQVYAGGGSYTMSHSAEVLVLDGTRTVRAILPTGASGAEIADTVGLVIDAHKEGVTQ